MEKRLQIPPFQFPVSKIPRRPLGYDRPATEHVFASLAASYEQIWMERDALRHRVAELESELGQLREQVPLPHEALVEAHRSARSAREEAQRDAEEILAQARAVADQLVETRDDELRARDATHGAELAEERRRVEEELEHIGNLARATADDLMSFLRDAIARARASGSETASRDEEPGREARSA